MVILKHEVMRRRALAIAVSVASSVGAVAVGAQENSASARLEEVLVTATKRTERLQDVPFSMDAFTEQLIKDTGLSNPQDLAMLTPGLVFTETIGRQTGSPSIRGVAPVAFQDPTVLVYLDGFTLGFTSEGNNAKIFDLERIEVLKGPQATLYGRNALAGVINYITRKPGDEFDGYVRAEVGDYGHQDYGLSVGGPLVAGKLYGKLAIGHRESGGFLDNTATGRSNVNDEKDFNVGAILRFTPTEDIDASLTINYSESDDACGDCSAVPPGWGGGTFADYVLLGQGIPDINSVNRTVSQDILGGYEKKESTYVLKVDWDLGGATLTNILGYGDLESNNQADIGRNDGPLVPAIPIFPPVLTFDNNIHTDGWSEELRLTSSGDSRLQWLLGLYAYQVKKRTFLFTSNTLFDVVAESSVREIDNYAAFVNLEYELTDQLSLAAGLRYDYEEFSYTDLAVNSSRSESADELLPSLSLTYKPAESTTFYGTISQGYHAGGLNSERAPSSTYKPEFLWNYEVGAKGYFWDNRVNYSVALFYMDWEDQQLESSFVNEESSLNEVFVENVGESRIKGIEASVAADVTDQLTLSAGVSWLDAKYKKYQFLSAPGLGLDPDVAGNTLLYTPELTATVSAQYLTSLGMGNWNLRMRIDTSFSDEYPLDVTNAGIVDSYVLANVYAGVENDRFEIGVFADNVFDEEYIVGGFIPTFNPLFAFPPLATVGDPRIVGVRVRVNF